MKNKQHYYKYHIFCKVIDNYGDFGVCFRLAKQLVSEFNKQVILWVDNENILQKFLLVNNKEIQQINAEHNQNLIFKIWTKFNVINSLNSLNNNDFLNNSIIIEAFCCDLDCELLDYINNENNKTILISLDYFGLEKWILDCHLLPSFLNYYKHIKKYFFFPSYLPNSGGLIREKCIKKYIKKNIQNLVENIQTFKISLFFYQQPQLLLTFINAINYIAKKHKINIEINFCDLSNDNLNTVQNYNFDSLVKCNFIHFLSQNDYDNLLQNCHLNFVRGEDSLIRAFWSNNLFIWQIYQQQNDIHLQKLNDFLNYYFSITNFDTNLQTNLQNLFLFWNKNNYNNYQNSENNTIFFADLLLNIIKNYANIFAKNQSWLNFLNNQNSLCYNLTNFIDNL